jgi:hypothetical protein
MILEIADSTLTGLLLPASNTLFFLWTGATYASENQQNWREESSDLKESLETKKKRYGTYGRNVS